MENYYFKHPNHFGEMFGIFEEFYRSNAMADVIIACDGKTINAHKIVLSAGSDYFRRVLVGIKQQSHYPVLFINDISYEDMETILEFIYRGQIVVTRDKVESLRQAAYKLRVKGFENFLRKPFYSNGHLSNHLKLSNGTARNISMLNHENSKRSMQMHDPNENKRMRLNNNMSIAFDANRANGLVFNRFKDEAKRLSNGHSESVLFKNFHSTPSVSKRIQIEHLLKRQHPIVPPAEPLKIDMNEMKVKPELPSNAVSITPILRENHSPKDTSPSDSHDENEDNRRNENTENSSMEQTGNDSEALNLVNSGRSSKQANSNDDDCDSDDANEVNYTYEMDPTALNWGTYNDENMPENQDESESYDDEEDYFESVNRHGPAAQAMLAHANMKLNGQQNPMGGEFYYCEHCPKYFFDEDHLQLHIKRSHGLNKLNMCNICGKTYAWKSGLYKHKRHVHNISGKTLNPVNDNVIDPPSPIAQIPQIKFEPQISSIPQIKLENQMPTVSQVKYEPQNLSQSMPPPSLMSLIEQQQVIKAQ